MYKMQKSRHYKVRDHCHYTGKYLGATHSICNLNRKNSNFLPVFFHILCGYDIHLFIKDLAATDKSVKNSIDCIPNTKEQCISASKYILVNGKRKEVRFIDRFKFVNSSLVNLASKLKSEQFIECNKLNFDPDLREKNFTHMITWIRLTNVYILFHLMINFMNH